MLEPQRIGLHQARELCLNISFSSSQETASYRAARRGNAEERAKLKASAQIIVTIATIACNLTIASLLDFNPATS